MRIVTFGEVMLRLASEDFLRMRQSIPGRLDATFGGGELNVAISVAFQGGSSAYLTALPDNVITDSLLQDMRKLGVDDSLVQRSPVGRFGIYFVETGANQRGGTVTYDREFSSISMVESDFFHWHKAFDGATWFHITGITPAISKQAAASALESVKQAKERGITVSCDLNYRGKLWKWEEGTSQIDLARRTMKEMMPYIDVVIANEEDADRSLGISASETDIEAGELNIAGYEEVAREVVKQFPNVKKVAITLRESYSATHNNWGAMLFDVASDHAYFAPEDSSGKYSPYEIKNIIDRVGAGDSFAGGLVVALNTPELSDPQTAIRYATAASCLKHSIKGDFNYATRQEIEALMGGAASGRVQR
ncbi:2-dehydro-3-deoxygluconokinase [Polystyrenella longa]|uniref:2-dehydro-3-deoxygluconokinase n=1 Tax=Polystyrenella longa TaxID=2528007 RepID=A0A518CRT6_9PLAN|nr:sugar kinase [Polystyrenella longa]QDU81928.1 2-dehydro-3-deoxygluconokinase [Polystyrenella longa]